MLEAIIVNVEVTIILAVNVTLDFPTDIDIALAYRLGYLSVNSPTSDIRPRAIYDILRDESIQVFIAFV